MLSHARRDSDGRAPAARTTQRRASFPLLSALFISLVGAPQAGAEVGPFGGWINDLKEDASGRLLAATSFGGVYRSSDNAESWLQIYNDALDFDFIAIATNASGHIFIGSEGSPFAGGVGFVRSTNDGTSWEILSNALNTKGARDLLVMPSGEIFACAFSFNGGVFRSTDNGTTFTAVAGVSSVSATDIEANSSGHLFVGTRFDSNRVFRSTNNGATWQLANTGLTGDVNDIFIDAANTLFAATSTGVFTSTNNGTSWTSLNAPGPAIDYPSVVVVPGGTIYASFNGGIFSGGVYVSTNGGATWTQDPGLPVKVVNRLLRTSSGSLFAGGAGQGVYRLSSAPLRRSVRVLRSMTAAWEWKNNGLANTFITSIAQDAITRHVFVGTQHLGVFKSTDEGFTWVNSSNGIPPHEWINDVTVNIDGTVIASGVYNGIYRSTNGGASWTTTSPVAATALGCNAQGEVFAGFGSRMYKSTNGGVSFTSVILPSVQFIGDVAFDETAPAAMRGGSNTTILVATGTPGGFGSQGVWRSTDDGDTWGPFNSGLTNLNVTSIAVGSQPGSCRVSLGTKGAGLWDLDESAASFANSWVLSDVVPPTTTVIDVQRSELERQLAELREIRWSGDCFGSQKRAVKKDIRKIKRLLEALGIAGVDPDVLVGTAGSGILRQTLAATGAPEVPGFREGLVTQNDPNPFVSRTEIRYAIENDAPVSLRIYDVRGRKVETLVDEFKSAGSYNVTWDAKDRPSGIYFYRLSVAGSERTQKMALLR